MGSGSRDVDAWHANGLYAEDRGLQVPMTLKHGPVTSSGKAAPGSDPRIRHRIQIGMFRPIRVDHTNCLQVAIKTHSFILEFAGILAANLVRIYSNISASAVLAREAFPPCPTHLPTTRHSTSLSVAVTKSS